MSEPTDAEKAAIMEEMNLLLIQADIDLEARNARVLARVRELMGSKFHDEIIRFIEVSDGIQALRITEERPRDSLKQAQEYFRSSRIPFEWVEQYSSGYDGDSFHGYIYLKLKGRRWLSLSFDL